MGRTDPGPQKYKESNKIDSRFGLKVPHQDKYWTDVVLKAKNKDIGVKYNTTPGDKFSARYPQDNCQKFGKSQSEHDCSAAHYENYLRRDLHIKSALETKNCLAFQVKKVSFRNYTPKILSQEVNMGMWI